MPEVKRKFTPVLLAFLLIGCEKVEKEDDSSNNTLESRFKNEAVFGPMTDTLFDQLDSFTGSGDVFYHPLVELFWPVVLEEVIVPEPPYEIRGFTVAAFSRLETTSLGDCNPQTPFNVVAYVGDADPDSFEGGPDTLELPEIPFQSSTQVTGSKEPTSIWDFEVINVTLEEPVLIEEEENLWIGYVQAIEPDGISLACGYSVRLSEADIPPSVAGGYAQWEQGSSSPAWQVSDTITDRSHPAISVRIGY